MDDVDYSYDDSFLLGLSLLEATYEEDDARFDELMRLTDQDEIITALLQTNIVLMSTLNAAIEELNPGVFDPLITVRKLREEFLAKKAEA